MGPLQAIAPGPAQAVTPIADAFLEQYEAAPATVQWLRYNLRASTTRFGRVMTCCAMAAFADR